MKKTFLLISLPIFIAFITFAQDDNWDTKTFDVGNFNELYIEGGYRIHLAQGKQNMVVVKATDSDVFDYLQVKEWGDELRIDIEPDNIELDRIALYITFKDLEKLHIEGGVKLYTKGYLDLKDFDLYVAGGAKIEMDLKADNVKIVGEGGVLFDLEGVANSLYAKLTGAGHLNADDLRVKDATVKIEGVGTGSVYPLETLHAHIEGVGKVSYRGNPSVSKNIEGLGSVSRK